MIMEYGIHGSRLGPSLHSLGIKSHKQNDHLDRVLTTKEYSADSHLLMDNHVLRWRSLSTVAFFGK